MKTSTILILSAAKIFSFLDFKMCKMLSQKLDKFISFASIQVDELQLKAHMKLIRHA